MKIGKIIKNNQPKEFNKIKDNLLSKRDIEQLMKHSSYRRGNSGAIRQVRQGG
ncbi:hypothetical protein [Clostridium chauvoei]|uniref:Uncharacterized protein n=2 Tax=Clostridium chauvoei TaxID=46867 RepID=A0A1U6JHA2_9CLOT|nr:hypothetical protein [Clostridium chauvoei]MBX7280748.1 hypothetical protein [Clostridium chauvoei]MBX7283231.1 hypothetical protein [Clostridium chauvoei]MBX7285884.1 hypothetical protein [Clostridium chauvoei]MBX7288278.1 hypothetical protein [Clostridium chauvoei]MBX7290833.1 hypothetical protein [Clostridium chauvoei]